MSGAGRHAGQLFLDFPKAESDSRPLIESGSYAGALVVARHAPENFVDPAVTVVVQTIAALGIGTERGHVRGGEGGGAGD